MTAATAYTTLDSDDLGANKILRAATMSALDSNPVAIAQRGTGAPWLNGIGAIATLTSGSGNWTVPTGVYRIKVTAVGGGGGTSSDGGNTTFSSITANGGSAGNNASTTGAGGSGGGASGGDVNITGSRGQDGTATAGDHNPGFGGCSAMGSIGHGSDGSIGGGGGGGGTSIKVFSVEPGDVLAYSVGASGGANSTAGIIILEY